MSGSEQPESRRPIKARRWTMFQSFAAFLANRNVSPNVISITSILFGIAAGVLLAGTSIESLLPWQTVLLLLAAVMIQFRLIANLLDGMVAVEGKKGSVVGELYNEIPDRISDPAILIGAGFACGSHPYAGFAAALVAMFVAYIRAIGGCVDVGQVFLGPFAKQQRIAVVTVACLISAFLPASRLLDETTGLGILFWTLVVIIVGSVVTAVRRVLKIGELMREEQSID